jgi:hypothetical protein
MPQKLSRCADDGIAKHLRIASDTISTRESGAGGLLSTTKYKENFWRKIKLLLLMSACLVVQCRGPGALPSRAVVSADRSSADGNSRRPAMASSPCRWRAFNKKQRNKEVKSSTVDQHYFPITNLRNIFAGPSCAKIAIGQERSAQQNRVA